MFPVNTPVMVKMGEIAHQASYRGSVTDVLGVKYAICQTSMMQWMIVPEENLYRDFTTREYKTITLIPSSK